ncbi:hypothetical protein GCM10009727_28500 [Actinomadura napierensis]|uniref:Uncharacterized protein n=1 Tax=Actinomadura napierensis TaxID=267854 RepID=A0ABN2YZV9_9ACTN
MDSLLSLAAVALAMVAMALGMATLQAALDGQQVDAVQQKIVADALAMLIGAAVRSLWQPPEPRA